MKREYKSKYYTPHPRKLKTFVIDGVEYPIKEYCETHGLKYSIVNGRINSGYTPETAIQKDKIERITEKKCAWCGNEFKTNKPAEKWCCEECKMHSRESRKKNKYITFEGKKYTKTEFCKVHDIKVSTFDSRIRRGMTVDEAIQKGFTKICPICEKEFSAKNTGVKYCSTRCRKRAVTGKGAYKKPHSCKCIVCSKTFDSIRDDAKVCSKECRLSLNRIDRNRRYKHLKEVGQFDYSVTLSSVYEKFNGVCQMCNKKLNFDCDCISNNYPSIDHIIPTSKGGTHTWDNVQLLCRKCNCIKRNK